MARKSKTVEEDPDLQLGLPHVTGATEGQAETASADPTPANLLQTSEILHLDPDSLIADPTQNTRMIVPGSKQYGDTSFKELKESIKQDGVLQPLLFSIDPQNQPVLRAGYRRLEAVKQLREEFPQDTRYMTVPCVELQSGAHAQTLLRASLSENAYRKGLSAIDHMHIIRQFAATGMKDTEIARQMNRSKGWVSQRKALSKLPENLQREVHEGKLDAQAAYELTREPDATAAASAHVEEHGQADVADGSAPDWVKSKGKGKKAKAAKGSKITRSSLKGAKVKGGRLKLTSGGRSAKVVRGFFAAIASEKKQNAGAILTSKAIVGFLDGKVTEKAMRERIDANEPVGQPVADKPKAKAKSKPTEKAAKAKK